MANNVAGELTPSWDILVGLAASYRTDRPQTAVAPEIQRLQVALLAQEERGLGEVADALSTFTAAVAEPLIRDHSLHSVPITPQMREAWELAYPHHSLSSLQDESTEQIAGFVNGWKGKYFEVLVRDELNGGSWIGDLHLAPGQLAHLATQVNQPGWDLVITDSHGDVVQELQLKATNSLSYIKEALERYPDIQIVTTDEVIDASGHISDEFVDALTPSGISNAEMTDQVAGAMDTALGDGVVFDDVLDLLPGLPFVIIALDEGRQVIMRGKTLAAALESGGERMTASGAALAIGGALAWADCGLLSVPAALVVKTSITRQFRLRRGVNRLNTTIDRIRSEVEGVQATPI